MAEVTKLDPSEVALNEARREAALAERDRSRELTRLAKLDADYRELELAGKGRTEKMDLARDINNHVYVFNQEVSEKSVNLAIDALGSFHRKDPGCSITIQITSPGGDILSGFALIDYIRWLRLEGHSVTTVTFGYAASMAGVILQAGDQRVMSKNALLLIHEGSLGVRGDYAKVEDMVALMKKMHGMILDLFLERATVTRRFISKNWERRDWWITAEEALKYGFIDSIL